MPTYKIAVHRVDSTTPPDSAIAKIARDAFRRSLDDVTYIAFCVELDAGLWAPSRDEAVTHMTNEIKRLTELKEFDLDVYGAA